MCDLNSTYMAQLRPVAENWTRAECHRCSAIVGLSRREQRRLIREREAEVTATLWAKAHQAGLTKFAVPPFLVSLLCSALWKVILHLVSQAIADTYGPPPKE